MRWSGSIANSVDMNLSKLEEIVEDRRAWHATVHEVTKSRKRDLATEQKQCLKCCRRSKMFIPLENANSPLVVTTMCAVC